MKFRICNECQQKVKQTVNQLTHDGLWEIAHHCKQCDIHYQDLYRSNFDSPNELDMDQTVRYFQNTAIDTPEEAETVRDEAVEVVTQLRDLLFELSSLEIDLVDGLLEHYKVKL